MSSGVIKVSDNRQNAGAAAAVGGGPRKRAVQQRALQTRKALVTTAIEIFTTLGYDGVSVRALETAAKAQRGAVAHHYGGKEGLWKAAVAHILERYATLLGPLEDLLEDMDEDARVRALVTAFVRFSAETPELSRLIMQEGRHDTWRLEYLTDTFIRNRFAWIQDMIGLLDDPHTYYMAIGASTLVFDVEHECRRLFGVDPTSDEFIREHAAQVADMIISLRKRRDRR